MSDNTYNFSSSTVSSDFWKKLWLVNYNTGQMNNAVTEQVASDWWITLGGANNALTAEITCCKENGTVSYTAKNNYYIYDYYDWDGHFLELSHRYGVARNYFSKGCVNFEVNWVQGSRYPAPSHDDRHGNLAIVEFEGIDDGSILKIAYDSGLLYYDLINETQSRIVGIDDGSILKIAYDSGLSCYDIINGKQLTEGG